MLSKVVPNLHVYVPPRPLLTGEVVDVHPRHVPRDGRASTRSAWSVGPARRGELHLQRGATSCERASRARPRGHRVVTAAALGRSRRSGLVRRRGGPRARVISGGRGRDRREHGRAASAATRAKPRSTRAAPPAGTRPARRTCASRTSGSSRSAPRPRGIGDREIALFAWRAVRTAAHRDALDRHAARGDLEPREPRDRPPLGAAPRPPGTRTEPAPRSRRAARGALRDEAPRTPWVIALRPRLRGVDGRSLVGLFVPRNSGEAIQLRDARTATVLALGGVIVWIVALFRA